MSNGDDRFFAFIERGTNPTVSGADAPVNSLCTFGGTLYRKFGEGPNDWQIYPVAQQLADLMASQGVDTVAELQTWLNSHVTNVAQVRVLFREIISALVRLPP